MGRLVSTMATGLTFLAAVCCAFYSLIGLGFFSQHLNGFYPRALSAFHNLDAFFELYVFFSLAFLSLFGFISSVLCVYGIAKGDHKKIHFFSAYWLWVSFFFLSMGSGFLHGIFLGPYSPRGEYARALESYYTDKDGASKVQFYQGILVVCGCLIAAQSAFYVFLVSITIAKRVGECQSKRNNMLSTLTYH